MTTLVKASKKANNQFIGRQCWLHLDFVQFYEVNRYRADVGGRRLAEIVQALRGGRVQKKHVEWLNGRYAIPTNDIHLARSAWKQALLFLRRDLVLTIKWGIFADYRWVVEAEGGFHERTVMQIPTNGIDLSNAEWKQQGLLVHPRNAVLTKSAAYLQIVAGLSKNKIAYVWESIDFYSGTTDVLKPDD